jgi:hypothetical protein
MLDLYNKVFFALWLLFAIVALIGALVYAAYWHIVTAALSALLAWVTISADKEE